jgi:hypothetical protein
MKDKIFKLFGHNLINSSLRNKKNKNIWFSSNEQKNLITIILLNNLNKSSYPYKTEHENN